MADTPSRRAWRVYVTTPAVDGNIVQAVVVPTGDPLEALVVEVYASGSVHSSWTDFEMGERFYLAGGMRRKDDADLPACVVDTIARRFPEYAAAEARYPS